MPATTSVARAAPPTASSSSAASTPPSASAVPDEGPMPWWVPQWEAQTAWLHSYWQAWQTMAWMPWNMVVSAWQIADAHAPEKQPARGVLHSALGEIDLDKAP